MEQIISTRRNSPSGEWNSDWDILNQDVHMLDNYQLIDLDCGFSGDELQMVG